LPSVLARGLRGFAQTATWIWSIGTISVAAGLLVSMIRDVLAGRVGVDAVAFASMTAAIFLGEALAGVVVAVMYVYQIGVCFEEVGPAQTMEGNVENKSACCAGDARKERDFLPTIAGHQNGKDQD
jgi:hypothetical protein